MYVPQPYGQLYHCRTYVYTPTHVHFPDLWAAVSLQGVSHRHLSDHLSDLIETTLAQLEEAKIIAIDEDTDELEPLNMAMISSYYYIAYTTMRLFNENLSEKTKLRALFEIICGASEFDDLPVRPGEESSIERLIKHAKLSVSKPDYLSSTTKANALLQVGCFYHQLHEGRVCVDSCLTALKLI